MINPFLSLQILKRAFDTPTTSKKKSPQVRLVKSLLIRIIFVVFVASSHFRILQQREVI